MKALVMESGEHLDRLGEQIIDLEQSSEHANLHAENFRTFTRPAATELPGDSGSQLPAEELTTLLEELVLTRNQIVQYSAGRDDARLSAMSQRLNLITAELQRGVTKSRMQPAGILWNTLTRAARELAVICGKQICLEIEGSATEIDRTVLQTITDPLTLFVRYVCEQEIERPDIRLHSNKPAEGKLILRAFEQRDSVNIEVAHDGEALDPNLGAGAVMSVVNTSVERIGGAADWSCAPGHGSTLKIRIPLKSAIIPGLVVTSSAQRFVIPQADILELVSLKAERGKEQIEMVSGTPVWRRRGQLLPLAFLSQVLKAGAARNCAGPEVANIVVLQAADRQFGLVVDAINHTQEIVVKPLNTPLKRLRCYAGATIIGDGDVALILDVVGIAEFSGVFSESRSNLQNDSNSAGLPGANAQQFLIFRAGSFERLAVPLAMVTRLEQIPQQNIEQAAGGSVVQYGGEILPLVPLATQLGGSPPSSVLQDPAAVIVFADGEQRVGLLVDQLIDIVDDTITARKFSSRPGLLGSAVVGGKVTDFLDLQAVIGSLGENWSHKQLGTGRQTSVLVAEESPFSRGLVRNYLEMAGLRVIEASTAGEALEKLRSDLVDLVVAALDLPRRGAFELLTSIRNQPALSHLPVLAFSSKPRDAHPAQADEVKFSDCLFEYDRAAMLVSLQRLSVALDARETRKESARVGR